MSLEKGTNSYATVEEADAYFALRLHSNAWTAATPSFKEAALVSATKAIEWLSLAGSKADEDQALEFPRLGQESVPQGIIDAVFEEAIARLESGNSQRLRLQREGVTQASVGRTSESYAKNSNGGNAKPKNLLSSEATQLLSRYIQTSFRMR